MLTGISGSKMVAQRLDDRRRARIRRAGGGRASFSAMAYGLADRVRGHRRVAPATVSPSRSAARSVCQARVAHLTRTGNSRTPANSCELAQLFVVGVGVRRLARSPGRGSRGTAPRPRRTVLPLHRLGHQRGRGGRDRAARALEARRRASRSPSSAQRDLHPVAAQRVVALGLAVGVGERPEVARPPVVVEEDLLIEVAQLVDISRRPRAPGRGRAPEPRPPRGVL